VEEVLLELKAIDEAALLKYLAALHKTRFVSTDVLNNITGVAEMIVHLVGPPPAGRGSSKDRVP